MYLGPPDITFRQSLLRLGDTHFGDLSFVHRERLQLGQPLEMHQPGVGDWGTVEVELLQLGQPREMYQPRVGSWHEVDSV